MTPTAALETESWHGTDNGYINRGCRCDDCRRAHTVNQRAKYRQRRQRLEAGAATPTHGKPSTYTNWGCRCDECRAAWTTAARARRKRGLS